MRRRRRRRGGGGGGEEEEEEKEEEDKHHEVAHGDKILVLEFCSDSNLLFELLHLVVAPVIRQLVDNLHSYLEEEVGEREGGREGWETTGRRAGGSGGKGEEDEIPFPSSRDVCRGRRQRWRLRLTSSQHHSVLGIRHRRALSFS